MAFSDEKEMLRTLTEITSYRWPSLAELLEPPQVSDQLELNDFDREFLQGVRIQP